MEVGYLPDMFGHVAQMPQLLAQAGLGARRGVAGRARRRRPDRLRLDRPGRVEGPGRVPRRRLRQRCRPPRGRQAAGAPAGGLEDEFASFLPDDAPMLLMNGSDHLRPQPWLGRVVAEANELQDDFDAGGHVAARVPRRRAAPTAWSSGPASCGPAPGRTC